MGYEYIDLLNDLRKVVDDYEKAIDLTKIILNEVRAYGNSEKISLLLQMMIKILKRLEKIANAGMTINIHSSNANVNSTIEYINVFSKYIALVSIPYEKDLLNEVRDMLVQKAGKDAECIKQISEIIETINRIEKLYSKIIVMQK